MGAFPRQPFAWRAVALVLAVVAIATAAVVVAVTVGIRFSPLADLGGSAAAQLIAVAVAAAALPLLALITREVGGSRRAQAATVWGVTTAAPLLLLGDAPVVTAVDLLAVTAVLFCVVRTVLRDDGRWWFVTGAVAGVAAAASALVGVLGIGVITGLALCGPRRWFSSGWFWGGVALAAVLATPSVLYAVLMSDVPWPTFSGANGGFWSVLWVSLGPVTLVFGAAGVVRMLRAPAWRRMRFVAVTVAVTVLLAPVVGVSGQQTAGAWMVLVAIGAAAVGRWACTRGRRAAVTALIVVNAGVCALAAFALAGGWS